MIIIKLFGVLCDLLISLYIVPKGAVSGKCGSDDDLYVNIKGYHAVKVLRVRYSCPPRGLFPRLFLLYLNVLSKPKRVIVLPNQISFNRFTLNSN